MSITERAPKRTKLLDDASSGSGDEESADEHPQNLGFGINEEYARRFEHNKKREERQQLEEKYGKDFARPSAKRMRDEGSEDDDEESSSDEEEDDDAEFATEDVDNEILATLNAIKNKDPRVYDKGAKFYSDFELTNGAGDTKKEKPMYLQDYHRRNLLSGNDGIEEDSAPMQTYQGEQDELRRKLVGSMHAEAAGKDKEDEQSDEDDFLVAKSKPAHDTMPVAKARKLTEQDIAVAEKDPETYLSNFMAARAWLPKAGSQWEAFESDDSEDEQRADEFEEAYNMRFEDPTTANEKLLSFARDVGKYSVRRDEKNNRKRAREREQEKRDFERSEREGERARLRKLKIEEAEEKLQKIKEAAGIRGHTVKLEDWRDIIEGDFDEKWEAEMMRRFGDDYYAEDEGERLSDDGNAEGDNKKRKIKKPKWDDDIDIGDIVPDFDDENDQPAFELSSDDEAADRNSAPEDLESDDPAKSSSKKKKKDRAREKSDAKRAARLEHRQIEEMVDSALPLNHPSLAPSASKSGVPVVGFRYRATSPTSFGLSTRDILFADDADLNQFAGLKKLAAYRDPEKKRRDKKKFSKKGRLRQWRKDTFGDPEAPTGGFERLLGRRDYNGPIINGGAEIDHAGGEKKKKKRSRKGKKSADVSA